MNARPNPFTIINDWIERIVEWPFSFFPPHTLEPAEVQRRLERAMENRTRTQGGGLHLAPNDYDIFLSIKDHQDLLPGAKFYIEDWKNHLVNVAQKRDYTLKTDPVIRMHADTALRPGAVRIVAELKDNADGESMRTQTIGPEDLRRMNLRPPFPPPPQPGPGPQGMPFPPYTPSNQPHTPPVIPPTLMPRTSLRISHPQAGQQVFRIDKPEVNIGRQLTNDIVVEDKKVSRHHAQIKYQPNGQFVLFDLSSTNGIKVNGKDHIRQHTLRDNDHFSIGSYEFYFVRG